MATTARTFEHPDLADIELTTVLFALSDPARLDLVRQLAAKGPQTVAQCHVLDPTVPKSTFSHHLKTLREAGLVDCERRGTYVYYWLQPNALAALSTLLSPS